MTTQKELSEMSVKKGRKYGRLTVLENLGKNSRGVEMWECACDCGALRKVSKYNLMSGISKSCGCIAVERFTRHGYSKAGKISREYSSWLSAKRRCKNPNEKGFENYGGRGITMCDRWVNSFPNFIEDMGDAPTSKHTLDRVDNNKGYSKENCRWATMGEQMRNKRNNVVFEGENAVDAVKRLGGGTTLINGRLKRGWSLEKAFTTPVIKRIAQK